MQPSYLPLVKIFGPEVRHTVPLFQRPYVWNKEEQWEPLWQDISNLADRVLTTEIDKTIAGHFLGTVVLQQTQSFSGSIPRREIIDGQQRLTTLQILLHAAQHALASLSTEAKSATDGSGAHKADVAARQISPLSVNPAYDVKEEKYKVWPINEDRKAFQEVIVAGDSDVLKNIPTQLARAYTFFHIAIHNWLHLDAERAARATALSSALKEHLRLIVLDLDETDEPQAIFETLNANGAPLLPADLMKNWLLWEATRQKTHNLQNLYEKYWQFLDREPEYWRGKSGSGHAARARVDSFYRIVLFAVRTSQLQSSIFMKDSLITLLHAVRNQVSSPLLIICQHSWLTFTPTVAVSERSIRLQERQDLTRSYAALELSISQLSTLCFWN